LFSEKKLVWYRDVSFLSDTKISLSEEVLGWIQGLQNLLEKEPAVGFLMTATAIDRRQKIIKWFMENCHTEILEAPKLVGCEQYILGQIKREKKKITSDALDKFLKKTGNDLTVIDSELNKLLLYTVDKSDIDVPDIDAIVVDLRDRDFFEAIDLFFGDDVRGFSQGIQRHFLYHEEGRPLLAALQNRVRLLIQLRQFSENDGLGSVNKNELERLKIKYHEICNTGTGSVFAQNPWYLGKLFTIAHTWSLGDWVSFQIKLLDAIVALSENYDRQPSIFEKLYFQRKLMMDHPSMLSAI
jgi:DNA polymerase-3 subunit delta